MEFFAEEGIRGSGFPGDTSLVEGHMRGSGKWPQYLREGLHSVGCSRNRVHGSLPEEETVA
jgi:hypothetical protein